MIIRVALWPLIGFCYKEAAVGVAFALLLSTNGFLIGTGVPGIMLAAAALTFFSDMFILLLCFP